jgi:hypothetical protein
MVLNTYDLHEKAMNKVINARYGKNAAIQQLVKVCAWCGNYPALKEKQAYTHGICRKHKRRFLKPYERLQNT